MALGAHAVFARRAGFVLGGPAYVQGVDGKLAARHPDATLTPEALACAQYRPGGFGAGAPTYASLNDLTAWRNDTGAVIGNPNDTSPDGPIAAGVWQLGGIPGGSPIRRGPVIAGSYPVGTPPTASRL